MINIDEIIKMLDWNNDENVHNKGLEEAQNVRCLRAFVQPMDELYNKNVWENCAKVLYDRSDKEIEGYLEDMFRWLRDANWPGASIIAKRLNKFKDKDSLEFAKKEAIIIAQALGNKSWEENIQECVK